MFKNKGNGFIPVWMYSDQEYTLQCLMVNISAGGCSMLVSKQIPQLEGELHLKVYSSDKGLQEQLTLRAEQRWSDDTYSVDNKHVGLEFTDLSGGTKLKIDRQVQSFANVSVDGLSLVHLFRTDYTREINDTSLDALIERLSKANLDTKRITDGRKR